MVHLFNRKIWRQAKELRLERKRKEDAKQHARQQLQVILFSVASLDDNNEREDNFRLVCQTLRNFPDLAGERFTFKDGGIPIDVCPFTCSIHLREACPLFHLLVAKAPLTIIMEAYNMTPTIETICYQQGSRQHFEPVPPQSFALLCYGNGTNEVVSFLLSTSPKAVCQLDIYGYQPIDYALAAASKEKKYCSLETLRLVAHANPKCILTMQPPERFPYSQGYSTLMRAITDPNVPADAVAILAQELPSSLLSRIVIKVPPRIHRMEVNWRSKKWKILFDNLRTTKMSVSLEKVKITSRELMALVSVMSTCHILTVDGCTITAAPKICLVPKDNWSTVKNICLLNCRLSLPALNGLLHGLKELPRLKELELCSPLCDEGLDIDVTNFVLESLECLNLDRMVFVGYAMYGLPRVRNVLRTCWSITTSIIYKKQPGTADEASLSYYSKRNIAAAKVKNSPDTTTVLIETLVDLQADSPTTEMELLLMHPMPDRLVLSLLFEMLQQTAGLIIEDGT